MELQTSQETGWSATESSGGKKPWAARVVLLLSSVLMTVLALVGVAVTAPSSTGLVSLPQSVAPQVASAHLVGATTGSQSLSLAISLRSRNQAGLQDYAAQVAQPKAKLYHQYLTPAQFASVFGADPAALNSVEHYMQQQGLHLSAAQSGGLFLTFSGTVSQVESAFHTQINNYKAVDGRSVYANANALQVPSALASSIMDVAGTENIRVEHPATVTAPKQATAVTSHVTVTCPTTVATANTVNGAVYDYAGMMPTQINNAYGMTGSSTTPGAGVWVALIENDGFSTADLAQYETCVNPAMVAAVSATPGTAYSSSGLIQTRYPGLGSVITPGTNAQAVESEMELVLGEVPNITHLTVVETAPTAMGTQLALSDIANNNGPQVIGDQWGMCEADLGFPNAQAEEQLFMQMALQGQTTLAATGNNGLYACNGDSNNFRSNGFGVQDPASDPFVTAVGGAQLEFSTATVASAVRAAEQPWFDANTSATGTNAAGGGGISIFWPAMPWQISATPTTTSGAVYQTDLALAAHGLVGVKAVYNNGSTPARVVPDVSANADPAHSSYAIYCSVGSCLSGSTVFTNVGGTGAAEAVWVAAATLSVQTALPAGSNTGSRLGNIAPALYTAYTTDINNFGAAYTTLGTTKYCDYKKTLGAAVATATAFSVACADGGTNINFILNNSLIVKTTSATVNTVFPASAGFQQPGVAAGTPENLYATDAGFAVFGSSTTYTSGYNALTGLGSPNVGLTTGYTTVNSQLAAYLAAQSRVAIPRMYMVAQASSDKTLWIGSFAINQYVPNMPAYTQWTQLGTTVYNSAPAVVDDAMFGGTANNLYIFGANPLSPTGVSEIDYKIATATASNVTVSGPLPAAAPNNTCASVSAFSNADTAHAPSAAGYGVYCVTPSGALYADTVTATSGVFGTWNALAASGVSSAPQIASDGSPTNTNNPTFALIFQSTGQSNVQFMNATGAGSFASVTGSASPISLASAGTLQTTCNSTPSLAYVPAGAGFAASCIASDSHNMWANVYRPSKAVGTQWSFWQYLGQPSPSVTFLPGSVVAVDNIANDAGNGLVFYIAEGSDKGMYLDVVNPTSTTTLSKISGWQSVSLPGIFNGNAGADFANS